MNLKREVGEKKFALTPTLSPVERELGFPRPVKSGGGLVVILGFNAREDCTADSSGISGVGRLLIG